MTRSIQKTPRALEDLIEIATYLAERSLPASDRFIRQAQLQFELLARSPGIGAERSFRSRRLRGIQSHAIRGFPTYIVFYRATRTRLLIDRVLRGMRNLDAIFEK